MNWAERNYPDLFPAAVVQRLPDVVHEGVVYNARVYSGSWGSRYLGVTRDGRVFGLGDFTGMQLQQFETVSHWAPAVIADTCPSLQVLASPAPTTVQAGQRATFAVAASASRGPLKYQWYRNGIPIIGASEATYTSPPTLLSQGGSIYTVEVRAGAASLLSDPATLSVTPGLQPWSRFLWAEAGIPQSNSVTTWSDGTTTNYSPALVLVDPDRPSAPVEVEFAGQTGNVFITGSEPEQLDFHFWAAGVTFGDLARAGDYGYITYVKGDRFRKIRLARAASLPQAEMLSSISTGSLCSGAAFINDPVRPEQSLLIATAPPSGGTCNALQKRRLALPMDLGPNDPPLEFLGSVLLTLRSGDGALRGFLIQRDRQVIEVDHRFREVRTLFSAAGSGEVKVLFADYERQGLLAFDEGDGKVRVVGPSPRTASDLVTDVSSQLIQIVGVTHGESSQLLFVDRRDLFLKAFSLSDRRVSTLLRVDRAEIVDAGRDATILYVAGPGQPRLISVGSDLGVRSLSDAAFSRESALRQCMPTASRIVCRLLGGLATVPRQGGTTIFTGYGDKFNLDANAPWKVIGETIWFNSMNRNGMEPGLRSVRADGTAPSRIPDSILVSSVDNRFAKLERADALWQSDRWLTNYLQVHSEQNGLQILDGRTGQTTVTYGTLPSFTTPRVGGWFLPFYRSIETGHPQLIQFLGVVAGATPFFELFMIRGDRPGLERVTRYVP